MMIFHYSPMNPHLKMWAEQTWIIPIWIWLDQSPSTHHPRNIFVRHYRVMWVWWYHRDDLGMHIDDGLAVSNVEMQVKLMGWWRIGDNIARCARHFEACLICWYDYVTDGLGNVQLMISKSDSLERKVSESSCHVICIRYICIRSHKTAPPPQLKSQYQNQKPNSDDVHIMLTVIIKRG